MMYQCIAHNEYDPWTDGTFNADFSYLPFPNCVHLLCKTRRLFSTSPEPLSCHWFLSFLATQLTMRQTTEACLCKVVVPLGDASMHFVQALPDHRPHWLRCLLASCHLFQAWLNECAPVFSGWLRYIVSDNPKCKLLYVLWLSLFLFSFFSFFILS